MNNLNLPAIKLQYNLIAVFMHDAQKGVLDVSYSSSGNNVDIQVVVLEGSKVDTLIRSRISAQFPRHCINLDFIEISKDEFNENRGNWNPKAYTWLHHLLFSKAEAL